MPLPSTGNPELDRGIISSILTLITTWTARRLQPRAKIRFFTPYESTFHVQLPGSPSSLIHTRSVRVENHGRDTATNVEVHYAFKPEHFKITPTLANEIIVTPQNSCIIRIPNLAPKEGFWIEMITANILPNLTNVRSDAGPAQPINVRPQLVLPKPAQFIVILLLLLGLGAFFYLMISAIEFLAASRFS